MYSKKKSKQQNPRKTLAKQCRIFLQFDKFFDHFKIQRGCVLFSLAGYFSVSAEPIGRFPPKLGYRPNFLRGIFWAGHWAASSTKNVRF